MEQSIKVVIIGDGAVGKTAWLSAVLKSSFQTEYIPTTGPSVHEYKSTYQDHTLTYSFWDCPGHPYYQGIREAYYIGAQAGIVLYDCTSIHTKSSASLFKRDLLRTCSDIPVVVVRNKIDLIAELYEVNQPVIDMSVKTGVNLFGPIKQLDEYFMNRKVIQNWEDANKF